MAGSALSTDEEPLSRSRSESGRKFVDQVEEALRTKTFVSLVLRGPKKPSGKKKKNGTAATTNISEDLRGSIRQVLGRLIRISPSKKKRGRRPNKSGNNSSDNDATLVMQLTVKYHGATDICKNFPLPEVPKTIYDLIVGDPAEMASEWGVEAVRAQTIRSAQLVATDQICDLALGGNNGNSDKGTMRTQRVQTPTTDEHGSAASAPAAAIAMSHDRVKQVPLSNRAEFFQRLGVTKDDGQPKPRMKGKLRQCQKFVEIVGRIVDECQTQQQQQRQQQQRNHHHQPISVVDMGCGRAYLTFALHAYLQERYGTVKVATTGIDVRPKLVAEISDIARSLGRDFDTLTFEEGTIEKVVAQTSTLWSNASNNANNDANNDANANANDEEQPSLNVLVALHACDTATDDALYSGIAQNADVIVVAPCCHKQVRPQLNVHVSSTRQTHPLSSVLKHGVYRERMSETVTDSLRALLLEFAGYKVQVFEFIGGEHTSKNVMITAVKSRQTLAESDAESIRQQILSLAGLYGITRQKLAHWMEFDLLGGGGKPATTRDPSSRKAKKQHPVSKIRMPPARQ
eukprot:jgi/Psemu1/215267/e_gw1.734.3.1